MNRQKTRSRITIWQTLVGDQQIRRALRRVARRWVLEKIELYAHSRINSAPKSWLISNRLLASYFGIFGVVARNVSTRLLPWDPLSKSNASTIDIFILTSSKDLSILPYSIFFATNSTSNAIGNLYVVAPSVLESEIRKLLGKTSIKYHFLSDESLVAEYLNDVNQGITGTPKMEILKYLCALKSKSGNALVIDGDTLLIRKRNWVSNETQIIPVAQEYLERHIDFSTQVIHKLNRSGLGFITHHQLIRKSFLIDMLNEAGGMDNLAIIFQQTFVDFKRGTSRAYPSEWQLYGDWLSTKYQTQVRYCLFSNIGMAREEFLAANSVFLTDLPGLHKLHERLNSIKGLGSISLHSYKTSI
jgi:hypothetical protein